VRALAALACAVVAVALGACGGDDEPAATTAAPTPEATTTAAAPAPATTTATEPPTATTGVPKGGVTTGETTSTSGGGESGAGGAGDEEPARVPVTLTHASGRLSPTTVTVPAFLTLEITISGPATTATLPGGRALVVPGTQTLTGLKPGNYTISTADGGKTTLNVVNGGDPGP
jgi:hypothetical protein